MACGVLDSRTRATAARRTRAARCPPVHRAHAHAHTHTHSGEASATGAHAGQVGCSPAASLRDARSAREGLLLRLCREGL
eukprot:7132892-Prymnesium_polylepis.2